MVASVSTDGSQLWTKGARIKTPRKGEVKPLIFRSDSKLAICRPNPFRRTAISICAKLFWSGRPSMTSLARRIMPAHVPKTGNPSLMRRARGSKVPLDSNSMEIVVDSPPGITNASTPRRSSGTLTWRTVAPNFSSAVECSLEAPCKARTPTVLDKSGVYQPRSASLVSSSPISRPGIASPKPRLTLATIAGSW